jgi:polyhydroxybutyrate depolymerase
MKSLKFLLPALVLLLAAACSPATSVPPTSTPAPTLQPQDAQRELTVDGLERQYLLHLPPGITAQQPVPLVFVFHGFQESASYARTYSGLDEIADSAGFIVVYPNGSGPSASWNGGGCCGYAIANDVDDQAFVEAIIADLETFVTIDPQRIYAAGFSNGALLSYRLACEMSATFAAVAPVGGVLAYAPCEPDEPVAVMHVHGMSDRVVPFEGGGLNPGTGEPFPAVQESIAAWVTFNDCLEDPQVEQDEILTHTAYGGCASGASVELYAVDGIGHSWPSRYVVNISQTMWEFFAAHPKQ